MKDIVPREILARKDKIGFATPEHDWLTTLRPWVEETLSEERVRRVSVLKHSAIKRHWQEVLEGRRRFDWTIWRWLNLIRWAERWEVDFGS